MAADVSTSSAYKGHVYAAWDLLGHGMAFARSTDHGATWSGTAGQPVGSVIMSTASIASISVGTNGQVWIFGVDQRNSAIVYVTSTDGGDSFSAVQTAASGITLLNDPLPFRAETIPTSCAAGNQVVVAWPDGRDTDPHIYYRRTNASGTGWHGSASGDLLTAAAPSAGGQADILPQLACTPDGEVGCCFYEYGPKTPGGPGLISVELAVSTDAAKTFPDRVNVTDHPWDPSVDPVTDEYGRHFIGDYFGFAASKLGFFPFWTDTRTGIQEIFTSRLAVRPADVYIRDSSSDIGTVPSPGNHWEAPDLIVSTDSSGPSSWTDQPLVHDGVTDFYVYGKASNLGPNTARQVTLAVTVGNFPSLLGMPGCEFRYPQDWYPGDWNTPAIRANHLYLGQSPPANIPAGGGPVILGPIKWPAAQIPAAGTWHPCLLAEVRASNDDSAGGTDGCPVPSSNDACYPGSFFWGVNDACQRNLTYATVAHPRRIEFPFIIGNPWSDARFIEIIVDRGESIAHPPMTLHVRPIQPGAQPLALGAQASEDDKRLGILVKETAHVSILRGIEETGDIWAAPGSIWRPPASHEHGDERLAGAARDGSGWRLHHRRSAVGFPVSPGQLFVGTLRFTPRAAHDDSELTIRIWQRNDRRVVTGVVTLVVRLDDRPD
jgi:hypothetical protein